METDDAANGEEVEPRVPIPLHDLVVSRAPTGADEYAIVNSQFGDLLNIAIDHHPVYRRVDIGRTGEVFRKLIHGLKKTENRITRVDLSLDIVVSKAGAGSSSLWVKDRQLSKYVGIVAAISC